MDGNDPSATNPVYIRIGDTVRTITSALSVTCAAGTNWFNSGSTELATYEVDYFVYLGYNATDGVVIGFSRIPYAKEYVDFSATTTNPLYCAISDISNAASGDDYENIGRFAATLSAGAGYTWTVPAFTNRNLIQNPIYTSRKLTATTVLISTVGTLTTTSDKVTKYIVDGHKMWFSSYFKIDDKGTGTTAINITLPFDMGYVTNEEREAFHGYSINGGFALNAQANVTARTLYVTKYDGGDPIFDSHVYVVTGVSSINAE